MKDDDYNKFHRRWVIVGTILAAATAGFSCWLLYTAIEFLVSVP